MGAGTIRSNWFRSQPVMVRTERKETSNAQRSMEVTDRKDDLTRPRCTSFCRCGVENKNGRIPPREVLWNPNFGRPVRLTSTC
jgi:hypothetical protein